jgi:hypothetical protein
MGRRILNDPELDAKWQKAIAGKDHEVEIDLICRTIGRPRGIDSEHLVLEYGRPFVGIARPKGYRQWAQKNAFATLKALLKEVKGTTARGSSLHPNVVQHSFTDGLRSTARTRSTSPCRTVLNTSILEFRSANRR